MPQSTRRWWQTCGIRLVADVVVVEGHHGHAVLAGPATPCTAQQHHQVQQSTRQDRKTALLLLWPLLALGRSWDLQACFARLVEVTKYTSQKCTRLLLYYCLLMIGGWNFASMYERCEFPHGMYYTAWTGFFNIG